MILIISAERDEHARELAARLSAKGAHAELLDLSTYPAHSALTVQFDGEQRAASTVLKTSDRTLDLDECRVIWWRRPQPLGLHAEVRDPTMQEFALGEAHSALAGLWMILDTFWINHPCRDEEAARKLFQLKVAREVGLRVPETCVTSDPVRARAFIDRWGAERTIYKAFSATERAWRETRLLKPSELDVLDNVKYAPVIFQECIAANADMRVTVVGQATFPAAIYSQETEYKVDFRMTMDAARVEPTILPPETSSKLSALMRRLGLVYGAIDMRLTPEGEFVFLEINPAGQWLFVEHRTGQSITDAMADLMVAHDRSAGRRVA